MERVVFSCFYSAIQQDNRIGATHISLYMALFHLCNMAGGGLTTPITRQKVMELSKISGLATYHKCIKDLSAFGYIDYHPSFNPAEPSRVRLLVTEKPLH